MDNMKKNKNVLLVNLPAVQNLLKSLGIDFKVLTNKKNVPTWNTDNGDYFGHHIQDNIDYCIIKCNMSNNKFHKLLVKNGLTKDMFK